MKPSSNDYPRMLFHRKHDPVVVRSEEEEAALGGEWSRTVPPPATEAAPARKPEPDEPEPEPEPEEEEPQDEPEEEPKQHHMPNPLKKLLRKTAGKPSKKRS